MPMAVVTEAWTGPQVAWQMARGRPGAFGGKLLNSWPVWLGLSAVFLVGLVDVRRLVSLHTLDLLVLLSFGVSLAFFNRGEIFESSALAVPPLAYLLVRTAWIGFRAGSRPVQARPRWPVWLLAVRNAVPARLPGRAERRAPANRDRRGLRRRRRRGPDPRGQGAVRRDAGRRRARLRSATLGRAHSRAHPAGRALRVDEPARRHVRAGCVPRLRSGRARLRLGGPVGRPPGRARHGDRRRPPRDPRPRARGAPARRRAPRGDARLRVGGLPVHDVRAACEHERRVDARLPRLGLLVGDPRRRLGASRSRSRAGRSSRRSCSRRSGSRTGRGSARRPSLAS